ncbi:MAG TPA: ferritin-like domain-containing protein [Verrucomicrobiae bacterium]|nr:ferritin-like domain-containing protein [Verrucomicrobiae bacterium]
MNNALHEAFLEELADAYNAEKQLTKALPKMAKAAQSNQLRNAIEMHLQETEQHANRLEQAAQTLGTTLKRKKCKGMEGIIEDGTDMVEEQENGSTDAVIIAAAQKVEHYEIATYGTLCSWAKEMGHTQAAELLHETLEEEKAADAKLSEIAKTEANAAAQH